MNHIRYENEQVDYSCDDAKETLLNSSLSLKVYGEYVALVNENDSWVLYQRYDGESKIKKGVQYLIIVLSYLILILWNHMFIMKVVNLITICGKNLILPLNRLLKP